MSDAEPVYPLSTDSLRRRSIRGAAITSISQGAKFVLMLVSQIVLARLLDPADFGIIAMVAPILGFVTIMADLGLVQAIVQRPVLTRGQLNSVFWVNATLSIGMAALLMASAPLLAWLYHEPRLVPVTLALASLVVVTGLSMQQAALLNRTMRYAVLAVSETLSMTLAVGVGALAAWQGLGYWALVLSQATATITTSAVIWTASSWRPSWPSFKADALSMLRFGGNVTVSNIANYLNTVLDNVMIGVYIGEVPLGLYDRAWKLTVLPLTQLMAPVSRVAIPALSRLVDDPERYRSAFSQILRMLLMACLPALAVAVVAAHPLIGLLFGAKWNDVAPVFSWLCVGALLTPINSAMFWLFISQGRSRDQMKYGTVAAVINIFTYAAGLHWGLIGVARTSAIASYLVPTPLLIWAGSRTGPFDKAMLLRLLYPFAVATAAAMATVKLYDRFCGIAGLLGLAIACVLAYGASMATLACFASGRAAIQNVFATIKALAPPMRGKTAF
jgi:PST family polysaccharide transporter